MKIAPTLAATLTLVLSGCHDDEARAGDATVPATTPAQTAASKADWDALWKYDVDRRTEFEARMAELIDELDRDIERLRAAAVERAQPTFDRTVEALEAARTRLRQDLESLRSASADAWQAGRDDLLEGAQRFRDEVQERWKELKR